jgi:Replication factor C C-terminal domain
VFAVLLQKLFDDGYSSTDIIGTLFRVVRNTEMMEFLKLEYIKVCTHTSASEHI